MNYVGLEQPEFIIKEDPFHSGSIYKFSLKKEHPPEWDMYCMLVKDYSDDVNTDFFIVDLRQGQILYRGKYSYTTMIQDARSLIMAGLQHVANMYYKLLSKEGVLDKAMSRTGVGYERVENKTVHIIPM